MAGQCTHHNHYKTYVKQRILHKFLFVVQENSDCRAECARQIIYCGASRRSHWPKQVRAVHEPGCPRRESNRDDDRHLRELLTPCQGVRGGEWLYSWYAANS